MINLYKNGIINIFIMRNFLTPTQASRYIDKNLGNNYIITLPISPDVDSYSALAEKLGVETITEGYYRLAHGDTKGQILIKISETDIEIEVNIKLEEDNAGNLIPITINLDDLFTFSNADFENYYVIWEDKITGEMSHTFENNYSGTIKIFGKSIIGGLTKNGGAAPGCDCIKSIKFNKPQILYSGNFIFSYLTNLEKVEGVLIFSTQISTLNGLFYLCTKLNDISNLKLVSQSSFNITSLKNLFNRCKDLNNITLALEKFQVSNIDDYTYAFIGTAIENTENKLIGNNATVCCYMFQNCTSLTEISSSKFEKCINGGDMFRGCTSLNKIPDDFKLPNLQNGLGMFIGTKLDLEDILKIYNSLPTPDENPQKANWDNKSDLDSNRYHIGFGYIEGQEEAIIEALGLTSWTREDGTDGGWPNTHGDKLPFDKYTKEAMSEKGWAISFG